MPDREARLPGRGRPDAHESVAFDPEAILATLGRHGVAFVLIGAFAAVSQGWSQPTADIDITPDRDIRNLERLADALRELEARVLTVTGDIDAGWPIDDQHLRLRDTTFLTTRYGEIDVVLDPAGAEGYADLARSSESFLIIVGGVEVRVANLERVIRSKRATNRAKDRDALPALEELLRRQREGQQ